MIQSKGLSTLIVTTLQKYGTIPVDFLAELLGRRTSEILEDLARLEEEGVIKRIGENVSLSQKKSASIW